MDLLARQGCGREREMNTAQMTASSTFFPFNAKKERIMNVWAS